MSQESSDITFYISIISSSLLAISEILPYINYIKSNGILETFLNFIKFNFKNENFIPVNNNLSDINELINTLNLFIHEMVSFKDLLKNSLENKKINISIN